MAYFNTIDVKGKSTGGYFPSNKLALAENETAELTLDADGSLVTSSVVITDVGSLYEPFAGSTLAAGWSSVVGTGASVSVANSICSIVSGTTAGASVNIHRALDYSPLILIFNFSISQRAANQDIYAGLEETGTFGEGVQFCRFHFFGTDNTKVAIESQSSADSGGSEGINTQMILPFGLTTNQVVFYQIIFDGSIKYYAGTSLDNMSLLATHHQHPNPYQVLELGCRTVNGGAFSGTSTTVAIDTVVGENYNNLKTSRASQQFVSINQNIGASVVNSSTTPLTAKGTYTFTITAATAAAGDTYTNNGITYTVFASIVGATSVIMYGSGAPAASGNLARVTGSGTDPIVFSAASKTDTFIGPTESSLSCAGLQVSLYTGQNCAIYVEQSPDGVNWDISDLYEYKYQTAPNFGVTVQAVSSYFRVRVANESAVLGTGAFRLQSVLCPIVEALPRSLSEEGNLKVGVYEIEDEQGNKVKIAPIGSLYTTKTVRLIGTGFVGSTIDANFWVSTTAASGSAAQGSGQIELKTNTTANGASYLASARTARFVSGTSNFYRAYVDYGTPVANNTKRWGVATAYNYTFTVTATNATVGAIYSNSGQDFVVLATITGTTTLTTAGSGIPASSGTLTLVSGTGNATITYSAAAKLETPTDGIMFELINQVFSVAVFKGSIADRVSNGSFNGDYGTTINSITSGSATYEIVYDQHQIILFIDNKRIHTFNASSAPLMNYISFPVRAENFNTNSSVTNTSLKVIDSVVMRCGEASSRPHWRNQVNANSGPIVLKRGAGTLQRVVINSWTDNATVALYDALSATNQIATIAPVTGGNTYTYQPFYLEYNLDYYTGLSLTTTGTINATIVYE